MGLVLIILFALYAYFAPSSSQVGPMSLSVKANNVISSTNSSYSTSNLIGTNTVSLSQYKDGTYSGSQVDAYYGIVQVEAIIKNGSISDVQFLSYPNTHSASVMINSYVMPVLTQEAIQSQNANVNLISGATLTSEAFSQSLASALLTAKN